jgi:hypothetical protein
LARSASSVSNSCLSSTLVRPAIHGKFSIEGAYAQAGGKLNTDALVCRQIMLNLEALMRLTIESSFKYT